MRLHFSALALILVGCGGIEGSGTSVTRAREVEPFHQLSVGSGITVKGSIGPRALSVTADENVIGLLETFVEADTLVIRLTKGTWVNGPARSPLPRSPSFLRRSTSKRTSTRVAPSPARRPSPPMPQRPAGRGPASA